jgi:hypothetical protein
VPDVGATWLLMLVSIGAMGAFAHRRIRST